MDIHKSDCALHNEPAYPREKCDCGVGQWWLISDEDRIVISSLLEELKGGKGRYSHDQLTHASNTIEDMKELAKKVEHTFDSGLNITAEVPDDFVPKECKFKYVESDEEGTSYYACSNTPDRVPCIPGQFEFCEEVKDD